MLGLLAHRVPPFQAGGGNAANGWRGSFFDSGIRLTVRGRPCPGPWEFAAEANICLSKESVF